MARRSARRCAMRAVPLRWYAALDAVPEGPLIVHRQRVHRRAAHPAIRPPRRGLARAVGHERRRGGFAFMRWRRSSDARSASSRTQRRTAPSSRRDQRRMRSLRELGRARQAKRRSPRSSSITVMTSPASATRCKPCAAIASPIPSPMPGAADLSAHVDFAALKREASAARTERLRPDAARRVPAQARLGRAPRASASARHARRRAEAHRLWRSAARRSAADGGAVQGARAAPSADLAAAASFRPRHFTVSCRTGHGDTRQGHVLRLDPREL